MRYFASFNDIQKVNDQPVAVELSGSQLNALTRNIKAGDATAIGVEVSGKRSVLIVPSNTLVEVVAQEPQGAFVLECYGLDQEATDGLNETAEDSRASWR